MVKYLAERVARRIGFGRLLRR